MTSQHDIPSPTESRRALRADHRRRFRRALGLTALGAIVPGAGLVRTRFRRIGWVVLTLFGLLVLAGVGFVLTSKSRLDAIVRLASRPDLLVWVAVATTAAGLVWIGTLVLTGWGTQPHDGSRGERLVLRGFTGLLCLAVAAPITQAVRFAAISRETLSEIFVATSTAAPSVRPAAAEVDPWAGTARVSVLLIGSDAGADRIGIRTDSMMVASIDTKGGDTVLVGVPRNIQNFAFPEDNPLSKVWPNGYTCGNDCILTNAWMEAVNHKDLFPGDPNPGLTTTRGLISEILGISIDYTAVIDLKGFQDLVDAMGGVTIDIPKDVPIYGQGDVSPPISEWIKAGQDQHLDGYHALWYARSRKYDDDFHRMKRQRCVVGALVGEVDPVAMLSRYPAMARAIQKHVRVDIPLADLPAWATLVERIQQGGMRSLALTPENISTVHPDLDAIHALVVKALKPPKQSTPTATSTSTSTPAKTPAATPSANPTTAVGLDEAC